jgi:DNA polymerase III delta subunit
MMEIKDINDSVDNIETNLLFAEKKLIFLNASNGVAIF